MLASPPPTTDAPIGAAERSRDFRERRRASVPACITPLHDICVVAGRGVHVVDSDGRSYVDLTGGLGAMLLGYAHPDLESAVVAQWRRLAHTSFPTMPSEPYVALAEALAGLAGSTDEPYKTFFVNSGAEAVDNAMKIASWVTGRSRFIALEGAFHGRTIGSLALTARERPFKVDLKIPLADTARLPLRLALDARDQGDTETSVDDALDAFCRVNGGAESFAAMIVEPVLGEGGILSLPPAFLVGAERFCRRYGITFVADEVQCGLGRTGAWLVSRALGARPDLVVVGKPLGGGLPLAAIVGRSALLDRLHAGALGTTQGGNPVACAAGLALLEVIRRDGLLERAAAIGDATRRCLGHLDGRERCGVALTLRVNGAMAALALNVGGAPERAAAMVAEILREARDRGVLLLRGGLAGEAVRMLPPLVIEEGTLEDALRIAASAVESVVARHAP